MSPFIFLPLLILSASIAASHEIPRLSIPRDSWAQTTQHASNEYQTFFFKQTLDHFNYNPKSYTTFNQKCIIDASYWGGSSSNSPIFAYLGAEGPMARDIPALGTITDFAARFNALVLYIEHRFYGNSVPYGLSLGEALKDPDLRGYLNSAQALADYASVIIHFKKKYGADKSPVIVIGGSYGGMLATWFRLKYPHIALGALASSAPVLLPVNFTPHFGYYEIVTKSFRETSEACYETIKKSWQEIDRVAAKPGGISYLSKIFNTCKPLKEASDLKDFLTNLYSGIAQYNDPYGERVSALCHALNDTRSSNVLHKIFSGVVAFSANLECYVNPPINASESIFGWIWQICSDIMFPMARGDNNTMFQPDTDTSLSSYVDFCKHTYGVAPRPHWVSTYYGGQDMKTVLRRFGSNIIFSNGLEDPYSNGGVLEDISDSIRAVYTAKGSHCMDIVTATPIDPKWL